MPRFLADESFPGPSVRLLRAAGGDLVFRQGLPAMAGVVYFRLDPAETEEPAHRLLTLLTEFDATLDGQFTTVKPRSVRQRPLV